MNVPCQPGLQKSYACQTLMFCVSILLVHLLSCCSLAQSTMLSKLDQRRIDRLVDAIVTSQLADGAIPAVGYRLEGQPVHIDPYFVNLAMLGLKTAQKYRPDPRVDQCVENWLQWCIANQKSDGTFSRYDGTLSADRRLMVNAREITPDSHDSYAGGFLAVADAFVTDTGNLSPELLQACQKSFQVLERCRDPNNKLYWNFDPENAPAGKQPVQYLLDGIEVHQGLLAAQRIFATAHQNDLAETAKERADELAGSFHKFYQPQHEYFACMYNDVLAEVPWMTQVAKSERLATVSALAFIENVPAEIKEKLWGKLIESHGKELNKSFSQRVFLEEDPTVERVFLAALKSAPEKEQKRLSALVRKRTDEILKAESDLDDPTQQGKSFPFVQRYGMLIQALAAHSMEFPGELPRLPLTEELPR